jgi:predicted dinucleotide-binding enzyme
MLIFAWNGNERLAPDAERAGVAVTLRRPLNDEKFEGRALAALVVELGSGAAAGTAKEAAEQDLVVLAANWASAQAALFSVGDWTGRILVDASNRVGGYQPLALGDLSGRTSSEIVADLVPGAKVIKAFNAVPMSWISDFSPSKRKTAFFVSGDDADAKKVVSDLIEEIGFCSLDLGSLAVGGRLQQLGGPLAGVSLTFSDRFVLPKHVQL